ncbi:hypothetical protein [uncultured Sphingomonas sp.]|uniref:hypothetical protein n=1 Tax=uncultured Sphingomonas sp. TaxID=158754 RepID=UPI0035CC279C
MQHSLRRTAAREIALRAAREGWLGRLADEVGLAHLLERLLDDEDVVHLAIYRAHHAHAVRRASPLALDLLRHLGTDPDEAAWCLEPDGDWRRWICGRPPMFTANMAARGQGRSLAAPRPRHARHAFLYGGLVMRGWKDARGGLGIRLSRYGLEVGARLANGAHLRTLGATATITVDAPETFRGAVVGRRADEVFDHPILVGRNYRIVRSGDYVSDVSFVGETSPWRVTLRAKRVPWRVPWAARQIE